MNNRTILHVSKTANGGRFIGFQLPHLVKAGLEIHLAVPSEGVLFEMAREAGVTVHIIPELGSRLPLKAARPLAGVIDILHPAVVHTHFVHSTLAVRLARTYSRQYFKNFFQVPGPLHLERRWSRWLDILTANKADEWGAACEWSRDRYLRSGVTHDRVHLTYYGKDLGDYDGDTRLDSDLRSAFGFSDSDFIATMVAHVYRPRMLRRRGIKGHEDFLNAIAIAREVDPSIKGLVVGGPRPKAENYYARLKRYSESRNGSAVRFVGPRLDVPDIYQMVDVAVHPSLSENLGGAGESLLMEVPTISTDVGGFPDVVQQGVTGLTVRPRAPKQLAAAILFSKQEFRVCRDYAKRGRQLMNTLGDAERNASRVVDAYKGMGVCFE